MIAPVFRKEDLEEEAQAAQTLTEILTGTPIDPTKPPENEAHQFRPTRIGFKVTLPHRGSKHDGAVLEIAINQIDRHHPELVREMLIREFAKIPALAGFPLKKDDITHDPIGDGASTITTVHIKLPKGRADDVIRSLAMMGKDSQAQQPLWTQRLQMQSNLVSHVRDEAEGFASRIKHFLGFGRS